MGYQRRGRCVIFNHKSFDNYNERRGTEKDVNSLGTCFHGLGFKVTVHTDLNKEEIETTLRDRK